MKLPENLYLAVSPFRTKVYLKPGFLVAGLRRNYDFPLNSTRVYRVPTEGLVDETRRFILDATGE